MATAGITKPNNASIGTRLETYAKTCSGAWEEMLTRLWLQKKLLVGWHRLGKKNVKHHNSPFTESLWMQGRKKREKNKEKESSPYMGSTLQSCILKTKVIATCIP